MTTGSKKTLIIAGPNGAGETTFAMEYLPNEADCPIFVNADLIAAGLSPLHPGRAVFRAGRRMVEEIQFHAKRGNSFAFETTLSGRSSIDSPVAGEGLSNQAIILALAHTRGRDRARRTEGAGRRAQRSRTRDSSAV